MTVSYSNASVRAVALGLNVSRATAVLPTSVASPQTLFTVSGGRIQLVSLIGQVTTVLGGTVQTIKLSAAATAGSALDLCIATVVTSAALGTHFTLPASPASSLVTDITTQSGVQVLTAPWLIDIGAITLTSSATNTGSVKWDLVYVPLDAASLVVAA